MGGQTARPFHVGLTAAREHGLVRTTDRVVLVVTGSGPKDVDAAMKACASTNISPITVAPSLADVRRTAGGLFVRADAASASAPSS
jgi:threonine synthase